MSEIRLTARQAEILRLKARGLTHGQVAERLGLSPRTVAFHIDNVMRKTKTDSMIVTLVAVGMMQITEKGRVTA